MTSASSSPAAAAAVEAFARDVLGCQCPAEVFRRVRVDDDVAAAGLRVARRILVGDRLLIYLVESADLSADPAADLAALGRAGAAERDARGFNRFRLAVAGGGTIPEPALPDGHCHFHSLSRGENPWADA